MNLFQLATKNVCVCSTQKDNNELEKKKNRKRISMNFDTFIRLN